VEDQPLAESWFLASRGYMIVIVPAAIFFRSRLFREYWQGKVIQPNHYLMGMLTVWIALEIGGILSLTGCLVSKGLVPGIIPGALAFMLFTPLWPSGRSMVVRHVGNTDDPSRYEEPH